MCEHYGDGSDGLVGGKSFDGVLPAAKRREQRSRRLSTAARESSGEREKTMRSRCGVNKCAG